MTTDVCVLLLLEEGRLIHLIADVFAGLTATGTGQASTSTPTSSGTPLVGTEGRKLTPSAWHEIELARQILDLLLLICERSLSFVGPQDPTPPLHTKGNSAPTAQSQRSQCVLAKHMDVVDAFLLSLIALFCNVLSQTTTRRAVLGALHGHVRHALWRVLSWSRDVSPHFVRFVSATLTASGGVEPERHASQLATLNRLDAHKKLAVHRIDTFFHSPESPAGCSTFQEESPVDVALYLACRHLWNDRRAEVRAALRDCSLVSTPSGLVAAASTSGANTFDPCSAPITVRFSLDDGRSEMVAVSRRLEEAVSHETFLDALDRLWAILSASVACGVPLEPLFYAPSSASDREKQTTSPSTFYDRCLRRLFIAAPANTGDAVLLHFTLRFVGFLLLESPVPELPGASWRTVILSNIAPFAVTVLAASAKPVKGGPSGGGNTPAVSLPSTSWEIVAFLRIAEECASSAQLEAWVRAGILHAVVALLEPFGESASLLTDAPTIHDGGLSEEVYLGSALLHARSEAAAIAAVTLKLLHSLLTNHKAMLVEVFGAEVHGGTKVMVPLFARIIVNHPTVEAAVDHTSETPGHVLPESRSLAYRLPPCCRSARNTPVGECAVLALDALLCLPLFEDRSRSETLLPLLPSLARATVRSVYPHLRGTLFRLLTRTITTAAELITLARSMPSAVASAVAVVVSYDGGRAREWEVAAGAEWLAQVLRLTMHDAALNESFNFLQTALPLKLLPLATLNGPTYISGTFLSLMLGLAQHQQRVGGGSSFSQHNALIPQNARSLPHWRALLATATEALTAIHKRWGGGSGDEAQENGSSSNCSSNVSGGGDGAKNSSLGRSYSSTDAPHRLVAALEETACQFVFVNGVVRGLHTMLHGAPELQQHISEEDATALLEALLACPPPEMMATAMAAYFRTEILYSAPLQRAYERAVMTACGFYSGCWYPATRTAPVLPLSDAGAMQPLSQRLADASMSAECRQCLCMLVTAMMVHLVPAHAAMAAVLADASPQLFLSAEQLPRCPAAIGMQCRLVAAFLPACDAALQAGWVGTAIKAAHRIVCGRGVREPPVTPLEGAAEIQLAEWVSAAASAYANPHCRLVTVAEQDDSAVFAKTLLAMLLHKDAAARALAFHACRAVSASAEGRSLLAADCNSCPGEASHKSCFSRLCYMTIGAPMNDSLLTTANTSAKTVMPSARDRKSSPAHSAVTPRGASARLMHHMTAEFHAGCDVISAAVTSGDERFAAALVKLRAMEQVERYWLMLDRSRAPIPLSLVRLLAAVSFADEIRLVIAKRPELLTLLLEHAAAAAPGANIAELEWGGASTSTLSTHGASSTLALLCLRNLCFSTAPKIALCQDGRLMTLLRTCISHHATNATSTKGGNTATRSTLDVARRRQLAIGALTALAHGNQRAKAYVRGVLAQHPPILLEGLSAAESHHDDLSSVIKESHTKIGEGDSPTGQRGRSVVHAADDKHRHNHRTAQHARHVTGYGDNPFGEQAAIAAHNVSILIALGVE